MVMVSWDGSFRYSGYVNLELFHILHLVSIVVAWVVVLYDKTFDILKVPAYHLSTIQYMAALYASVQIKACFHHRWKMSHCVSLFGVARLTD
jgi:hypothetical protein